MPRRSRICVAVLLAVAASHPAPADAVRIDYSLDLGVEHNDNVAMDAFDPQSQNILQAGLGYTITEETSTVRLMLTGRADYLHYEEVYSDRLDAMLRGRFDWMAVPDRLQLTVEDTMTTRPVDGLLPDTPANRQRINTFSAGPTLFFRWGGTTEGAAEARFIRDTAEETRELNAKRLATTLSASREFDGTSRISVHGGMEWIDYDHDDAARDVDRQDLFARYERDLAQLRLHVDAGWTRLDYDDGGSVDEPLVRLDLAWTPTARSRYSLLASSQLSDASRDITGLPSGGPDGQIPTGIPVGEVSPTSSHSKERRLEAGYEFTGVRFGFDLRPRAYRARYVDDDRLDHDGVALDAGVTWTLRPTLLLDASASYDEVDYVNLDSTTRSHRYGVGLRKEWTRNWSTRLSWGRYERKMSATGLRISQDVLYLGVTYANR